MNHTRTHKIENAKLGGGEKMISDLAIFTNVQAQASSENYTTRNKDCERYRQAIKTKIGPL